MQKDVVMETIFSDIKALPLFNGMSTVEQKEVIQAGKARSYKKGESLFLQGDPLKCFYIVINGAIRKFRMTPDGKEITIKLAIRGNVVGCTHAFEEYDYYQWNAEALEETTTLQYPIPWLKEKVKTQALLASNMLSILSHDAYMATIRSEQLITFTTMQRIACFIARLCAIYDFDPQHFTLPYSKTTIASKLSMETESLSRAFKKLSAQGITLNGKEVSVAEPARLVEYICQHCSAYEDCNGCALLKHGTEPKLDSIDIEGLDRKTHRHVKRITKRMESLDQIMENSHNCVNTTQQCQEIIDDLITVKRDYISNHIQNLLHIIKSDSNKAAKEEAAEHFRELSKYL